MSNAEIKKMTDQKNLIRLLKLAFKGNARNIYKRYDHLYGRIMRNISVNIIVNTKDCKIEHRRLVCKTFANINILCKEPPTERRTEKIVQMEVRKESSKRNKYSGITSQLNYSKERRKAK